MMTEILKSMESSLGATVTTDSIIDEAPDEYDLVGIRPVTNERTYDWLNPHQLYSIHSSVVDLYFEPAPADIQEQFTNHIQSE